MATDRTGLIQFRCVTDTHQQGVTGRTADTLTVHDGKWAYCPMDVRAAGHTWEDTGGIAIEMLRRGSPTINLDLDVRPHAQGTPARPPARRTAAHENGKTPGTRPAAPEKKRAR